jgi:hypothetical protein
MSVKFSSVRKEKDRVVAADGKEKTIEGRELLKGES